MAKKPGLIDAWKFFFGTLGVLIFGSCLILLCTWLFDPVLEYYSDKKIDVSDKNNYWIVDRYEDGNVKKPDDIMLSVVIPSFDEEKRLPLMLDETFRYLHEWSEFHEQYYEILLVSDGSTDGTDDVALKYLEQNMDTFRYFKLIQNQGKGAAIKVGVENALGKYILFADADGATDIRDLDKLFHDITTIEKMDNKLGGSVAVAVGSRAHLEKKSIATREWYRTVLMRGFHVFVMAMCTQNIRDTQCGFKLFTSVAAKFLFKSLHLYRWAFDIEVIYLAERFHIPMTEVAVNWHEVEGSKLIKSKMDVVTTSLTMARDIFCLRASYLAGIWQPAVYTPEVKNDEL